MQKASEYGDETFDLSTPEKLHAFAADLERVFREAVADAIAAHKAAGNPIYYSDPMRPDLIVEEMPDGSRTVIKVGANGADAAVS